LKSWNNLLEKNSIVQIGKIVGVHGLKGTLKVYPYSDDFVSLFKPGIFLLLRSSNKLEKSYEVNWVKPYKRLILVSLNQIRNRNLAEELAGYEFFINKSELPELDWGTYYWSDIIGLSVYTTADKYVGIVESIIPTGSNDVYVVKDSDRDHENEILIPALESVVLRIDLELKTIRVNLPDGL